MDRILSRAAALGSTKSEFAALVIQYWIAQGCPAVNAAEQRLLEKAAPNVGEVAVP